MRNKKYFLGAGAVSSIGVLAFVVLGIQPANSAGTATNFSPKVRYTATITVTSRTSGSFEDPAAACAQLKPGAPDFVTWYSSQDPASFANLNEAMVSYNGLWCDVLGTSDDAFIAYPARFGSIGVTATFTSLPAGWRACNANDSNESFAQAHLSAEYWAKADPNINSRPVDQRDADYLSWNVIGSGGGGGGSGSVLGFGNTDIYLGSVAYSPNAPSPKSSAILKYRQVFCGPDPSTTSGVGWRFYEGTYTSVPFSQWK